MILYNIVKQSTGNVVIKDATTNLILFVFINVNALEVKSDSEIIVKFGFNQWKSLNTQQVTFTQIEPASAISFTGDAYDLADLLSGSFFFELSGGGGSQNLSQVLTVGNESGSNDIEFDATFGLLFDNGSRLREGTIDAGLGGSKGIAQICAVGYELKWEAGRLYVMDGNGVFIRLSLYNFNITPTVNDDGTLGYLPGSLWTLDNGDTYLCTDSTTGAAVWVLQSNAIPTLEQVLNSGNNANNLDILNVDRATFNTATAETSGVAQLNWNDTDGTLNLGLKGGAVTLQIGQEIVARSVNKTSPLIDLLEANYQVVRVSGAQGQRLAVRLAQSDSEANCQSTLGIVTETILKNQEGFVTVLGQVKQINTTGSLQGETWNDGDVLYLSATTAGAITKVKPTFPNKIVIVGYVEYAHAVNGKIYANISRLETSIIDIQAAASDETTALTTGTAKVTFRTPAAFTLTGVRASLTTAQASGSIFTVDINQNGSSVLGTKLTIDNTEKTSVSAATQATITTSAITDDAEITVDIDQIGNGTAKGLKITLIGVRS